MDLSEVLGKNIPNSGSSKQNKKLEVKGVEVFGVPDWIMKGGSGVFAACVAGELTFEEASKVLCMEADEVERAVLDTVETGLSYYKYCMKNGTDFETDFKLNMCEVAQALHQIKDLEDEFLDMMSKDPDGNDFLDNLFLSE